MDTPHLDYAAMHHMMSRLERLEERLPLLRHDPQSFAAWCARLERLEERLSAMDKAPVLATAPAEFDPQRVPDGYSWHPSGVECRTISQAFSSNIGQAIQYLWRHMYKDTPRKNLEKAIKFIEFELEYLNGLGVVDLPAPALAGKLAADREHDALYDAFEVAAAASPPAVDPDHWSSIVEACERTAGVTDAVDEVAAEMAALPDVEFPPGPDPLSLDFIKVFTDMSYRMNEDARLKGFWVERERIARVTGGQAAVDAQAIALIHSEVSEALEGLRKDRDDEHLPHYKSVEVELADAVIRIMEYSAGRGWEVAEAIVDKLAYNRSRPHKHGKNF